MDSIISKNNTAKNNISEETNKPTLDKNTVDIINKILTKYIEVHYANIYKVSARKIDICIITAKIAEYYVNTLNIDIYNNFYFIQHCAYNIILLFYIKLYYNKFPFNNDNNIESYSLYNIIKKTHQQKKIEEISNTQIEKISQIDTKLCKFSTKNNKSCTLNSVKNSEFCLIHIKSIEQTELLMKQSEPNRSRSLDSILIPKKICCALKKNKEPCSRNAKEQSNYCGIHFHST